MSVMGGLDDNGLTIIPEPSAAPTRAAIEAVIEILNRGNDVREWPEDERELHRGADWLSFTSRRDGVLRLRAEKILALVAPTAAGDDERDWQQTAADRAHELGIAYAQRDVAKAENARLTAGVERFCDHVETDTGKPWCETFGVPLGDCPLRALIAEPTGGTE